MSAVRAFLVAWLLAAAAPLAAPSLAPEARAAGHDAGPAATRERALPAEVANVTHEPWNPRRGDDLAVYVTLRADAADGVQAVLLRWCRVEPDYACWPASLRMQPVGDSEVRWAGVIPWEPRFMKGDTVHVGYNLSVVYANGTFVDAPARNYNAPAAFPVESGGLYFFYDLRPAAKTLNAFNGTPLLLAATVAGGLLLAAWARRRSRRRPPPSTGPPPPEASGGEPHGP